MKSESFLQSFYHADQTTSRELFFNLIVTGLCPCTTATIGRVSKNQIFAYIRTFRSVKIEALFQVFDLNKQPVIFRIALIWPCERGHTEMVKYILRRLAWISCHKWVLSYFTTSCSGILHHTAMLLNREITLEANSMKFCLVTYIFFKLFSVVILLVTTLESLMKIYLLLRKL